MQAPSMTSCTFTSKCTLPLCIILCDVLYSIKSRSQPQVFLWLSEDKHYHIIRPTTISYPNALLLELLLFLFPAHGAEESSTKQSSAPSWSAGLITLVHTGFPVESLPKRQTCVCTTRIKLCLYPCTARQIACFGEYYQTAEFHMVCTYLVYFSLSCTKSQTVGNISGAGPCSYSEICLNYIDFALGLGNIDSRKCA